MMRSRLDVQIILAKEIVFTLPCWPLVGVPYLAEIKPVEPEEASTSVGNKRVYRNRPY